MLKQTEIDILESLLKALPPGTTYSGAWLASQVPQMIAAIRSDVHPGVFALRADEFHQDRQRKMDAAVTEAREIVARAEKDAASIASRSDQYAASTKARLASHLRDAIRALEN